MGIHEELDELLADPKCHAILVNALGVYRGALRSNDDGFADAFERAHIEDSLDRVDALRDLFERWP